MTYLFTLLFFAMATGAAVAAIWATVEESWDYVWATLPRWMHLRAADGPRPVLLRNAFDDARFA